MLIIYIVQRAIREEVECLRGQNIVPDEPLRANSNSGRSTGSELSQNYSEATFFTGLGALVLAGVSGVSKSASQLWSKNFGGGESVISGFLSSFLTDITVVASMYEFHVCLRRTLLRYY